MNGTPLFKAIAECVAAVNRCKVNGNERNLPMWQKRLDYLVSEHLPSGSGFDVGTTLDAASQCNRLLLNTQFHHMDGESGTYTGWSCHQVVVAPSLIHGFEVLVKGRDQNGIKDYVADTFAEALRLNATAYDVIDNT